MIVCPQSLRESCLHFLRQSIAQEVVPQCETINGHLIEDLLESLSNCGQLTDDILLRPLFDSRRTNLRSVRIPDASGLTSRGLRTLRTHTIEELMVSGLQKCTINELIGCLGEQTLQRIRCLNVSFSCFSATNRFCVVVGLSKLRNLRALDVSHTEFNVHGLEIVVQDLPLLHAINVSNTRVSDLSPLKKCRNRLTSLSAYNLRTGPEFVAIITDLPILRHLDVSDDRDNPLDVLQLISEDIASQLIQNLDKFPNLRSLDLSGRDVSRSDLIHFLRHKKSSSGECLQFLGLMQCSVASDPEILSVREWYSGDLVVSGHGNEDQVLEALTRYRRRPNFVQKYIIESILQPMRRHLRVIAIQMAGTACLYNLTKAEFGDQLHPNLLAKVVDMTLAAMATFPNHQQLQKNSLLTLCSDRVLQEVPFDRWKCAQLVLDALVAFREPAMARMAVAICSILAAKISTAETSALGAKPVYMEALLEIVRTRCQVPDINDVMLKFTLSALWNLTDESPKTCKMFLQKGGMDLYLQVLHSFNGESAVETKVLGLLNNIAEVEELRHHLLKKPFLLLLRQLMHSSKIDVSYFATGIFAHICSDDHNNVQDMDLDAILAELIEVVLNWEQPEGEMVAYRSFIPFLPLLKCFRAPAVQLWAIWAIHHVITKNPNRYCEMLVTEDGVDSIERIVESLEPLEEVKNFCEKILFVLKRN